MPLHSSSLNRLNLDKDMRTSALNGLKSLVPSRTKSRIKDHLCRLRDEISLTSPSKWIEADQYGKFFNNNWHVAYDSTPIPKSSMVQYGSLSLTKGNKSAIYPEYSCEFGVLKLSNALFYGGHGWIFTPQGHLLLDHCISAGNYESMAGHVKVPRLIPKGKRLNGVCLTIASDWGSHYGHWLVESLPRLELIRKTGFKLDDVDHFLCSKPSQGTPENLFKKLKIPMEKCIWINSNDRDIAFQVETLLAPSFPRTYQYPVPWVPKFLQNEFLPMPLAAPTRRLFLSRKDYKGRNPVNSENVTEILLRHKFEFFNPESHPNSQQVFSEAAIVVGATGSALAGLVFCQPGTKVLELVSTDMPILSGSPLAHAAGLEYGYLVCESSYQRADQWDGTQTTYDFHVNEDELDQTLAKLTSKSESLPSAAPSTAPGLSLK